MYKLAEEKNLTEHKQIEALPGPVKAYIPLSQHLGKICSPEVKVGEEVFLGQKIASVQAHVSAPIHASISGKVVAIVDWPHPVLGRTKAIVIENDGKDKSQAISHKPEDEIEKLSSEEIRNIIFEAGIVGMGGASFPTHVKLNPPKPVDTLIINGAECEPYLTSDSRLMVEKTNEILQGLELVKKCTGAKFVYIAIENNKPEAIKAFMASVLTRTPVNPQTGTPLKVIVLRSQYPQGGEKQLIKNILKKEVPQGKLPFDIGVIVHNTATVYAIYEAVYKNKPLYERIVTVTGRILTNPKNLLVRFGTPIKDLIDFCGPLREEPAKIIIGGPMMGFAQYTTSVPVIKSTGGLLLLNKKEAAIREEEFCIRCGACVRACPVGLLPCLLNLASEKKLWDQTKAYSVLDCIECGLCNYVCPANRRLTQSMKRAKLEAVK